MMWQLRPPAAEDVSFVFSSWLRSYRDAPAMANLTNTVYYKEMHRCIERVIQSDTCRVAVCCSAEPGDENVIFGYAIGEALGSELVLHWNYVKHPFRGFGIGKALETELLKNPHNTITYSCHSKLSRALLKNRPDYVYNPFRLWSHE